MDANTDNDPGMNTPVASFRVLLIGMLAIVVGTMLAAVLLPKWVPGLSASILGESPKIYWYLARGSAFVAFILLWLSMVFGLIITNRVARLWPGGPAAFDLHQYFSLLGLGFGLFHALILTGDRYIKASLIQVILPFAYQNYKPVWVGIGQLALYAWAIVIASFYIRKQLGNRTWRLIHFASFLAFSLVLVHGLVSGTDSHTIWASILYWSAGASVLLLLFYRILVTVGNKKPQRGRSSPQSAETMTLLEQGVPISSGENLRQNR
jgi:predicted ferric reductase